ncbi:hypothetical protein [Paraburkholderia sp. RL17-337-BIB-A]|uniref:hypothetical protein n=1 Tax=Paraburkholderia sp. RL17-337-BIB-A TaxID=3031636 RepID=UPI0038BC2717
MPLDLDKWNPLRFLRSHSAQKTASGHAGAPRTSQQSARQNGQHNTIRTRFCRSKSCGGKLIDMRSTAYAASS